MAAATWIYGHVRHPFPVDNPLIVLIENDAPHIATVNIVYILLCFTTPLILCSVLLSFAFICQARCIPIIATQSISSLASALPGDSWRPLLQTFRTKIFLALSDDFSTNIASELCGKDEQLKEQYSISENSQDARVSYFSGRTTARRPAIATSKSYDVARLAVFEPKVFTEIKNAQAIVLAYDGLNPLPPTYCYLKPYCLDPNVSYFEQLARGEI